jgi:O-antigen ligase
MLLNHCVWVLLDPSSNQLNSRNLILFIAFALPGVFSVRILETFKLWIHFIKLIEVFAIIMAVGSIVSTILPFLGGSLLKGIGGATYQAASYYAAFTFGLLGFYTFRAEKTLRYSLFTNKNGSFINTFFMIISFLAAILNGGRGAFILLIVYAVIIFYWIVIKRGITKQTIFRVFTLSLIIPFFSYLVYQGIIQNNFLEQGFRRATQFIELAISPESTDFYTASSGRDIVYETAIQGISESPIFGYGSFEHWEKVIHPHNIFLDLSLQYGVLFSGILIFGLLIWSLRSRKLWDTQKVFFSIILIYSLVNLMFSGGYFFHSFFWFALVSYLNHSNSYASLRSNRKSNWSLQ